MLSLLTAVAALKSSLELDLAYVIANPRKEMSVILPLVRAIQVEANGLSSTDQHYIADLVEIVAKLSAVINALSPPASTPVPKPVAPITPVPFLPTPAPPPAAPVVSATPTPAPIVTPPAATPKPVAPVVTPAPAPVAPVAPVVAPAPAVTPAK